MNEDKDELDINKENRENYEKLMEESSTNKDMYWDKNNPAVKIILLVIGTIIVLGLAYFVFKYINR